MSKTKLTAKALIDGKLDKAERAKLPPPLLALLAAGGHVKLTHADRRRLSKSALAQLALAGVIELTRQERDRLCPQELSVLAVSGRTELRPSEQAQLPLPLRLLVDDAGRAVADDFSRPFPRLARAAGM